MRLDERAPLLPLAASFAVGIVGASWLVLPAVWLVAVTGALLVAGHRRARAAVSTAWPRCCSSRASPRLGALRGSAPRAAARSHRAPAPSRRPSPSRDGSSRNRSAGPRIARALLLDVDGYLRGLRPASGSRAACSSRSTGRRSPSERVSASVPRSGSIGRSDSEIPASSTTRPTCAAKGSCSSAAAVATG